MAAKTRNRPPKKRSIQQPKTPPARRSPWLGAGAAIGLAALAAVVVLTVFSGGKSSEKFSTGLPRTPDYHSLLVDPADPQTLVLGTHTGLYLSKDGGRHWRLSGLPGDDAMNLARPAGRTVWLAGHNVFEKSVDGGTTWAAVRPSGLPSLDIHGFAVDPRSPRTLYAAVAGQGLYRSTDGARSFSLLSNEVGGAVMALAVMRDGRILAGDMQQGLLQSRDGGRSWRQTLGAQVLGLAVDPADPRRVLATGAGIALSSDGGRTWRPVLELSSGAGPVAWSPSNPRIAYAVGLDRTFYRSTDRGETWQVVGEGGGAS